MHSHSSEGTITVCTMAGFYPINYVLGCDIRRVPKGSEWMLRHYSAFNGPPERLKCRPFSDALNLCCMATGDCLFVRIQCHVQLSGSPVQSFVFFALCILCPTCFIDQRLKSTMTPLARKTYNRPNTVYVFRTIGESDLLRMVNVSEIKSI